MYNKIIIFIKLKNDMEQHDNTSKICITSITGLHIISPNDILYCQSDDHYTEINMQNGKKIISTYSLKKLETILNCEDFCRCHKSYIVNLQSVELISKSDIKVKTDVTIPVSRRKKQLIKEHFTKLI